MVDSFLLHHPQGRAFLLVVDDRDGCFDPSQEHFTLITPVELNIPDFEQMAFRYTVMELCIALKPFLLEHLFRCFDLQTLWYVDSDICFYSPDQHIQELLQTYQIVLTPHILSPYPDNDPKQDESYITRSGIYNAGFIGLAQGEQTQRFLKWWQKHTSKDCVVDFSRGVFVDQRWLDLAPVFFDSTVILREEGYNVAFWSINQRHVQWAHDQWQVNGKPLVFFHFAGFVVHDAKNLSKYQDRYELSAFPSLQALFADYRAQNLAHGYEAARQWRYTHGYFDNGAPIADVMRFIWRDYDGEKRWVQPFRTQGDDSFFIWLNSSAYHCTRSQPLVTNLAFEMYRRFDWHQVFHDPLGADRSEFARWFVHEMNYRALIDPVFVRPMKENLEKISVSYRQYILRFLYYILRAPLRLFGLHHIAKKIIGRPLVEKIYSRMVMPTRFR